MKTLAVNRPVKLCYSRPQLPFRQNIFCLINLVHSKDCNTCYAQTALSSCSGCCGEHTGLAYLSHINTRPTHESQLCHILPYLKEARKFSILFMQIHRGLATSKAPSRCLIRVEIIHKGRLHIHHSNSTPLRRYHFEGNRLLEGAMTM